MKVVSGLLILLIAGGVVGYICYNESDSPSSPPVTIGASDNVTQTRDISGSSMGE